MRSDAVLLAYTLGHLKNFNDKPEMVFSADRPFKDAKSDLISDFERSYIQDLLSRNEGNISRSAREAGIERAYLQRLIRKYALK